MLQLIINDFLNLSTIFPQTFLITLILYLLYLLVTVRFHTKELAFYKHGINLSFIFYFLIVLYITLLSRSPGNYNSPEFSLFVSWRYSAQTKAFIIENFLMLAPLGAYLTYFLNRKYSILLATLSCFGVSATIELLQYKHHLGFFQLDDIIGNVIGGFIGSLFVLVLRLIKPSPQDA